MICSTVFYNEIVCFYAIIDITVRATHNLSVGAIFETFPTDCIMLPAEDLLMTAMAAYPYVRLLFYAECSSPWNNGSAFVPDSRADFSFWPDYFAKKPLTVYSRKTKLKLC